MLSAWKWRIILPVAMVLLSIGLSPWFFNGLLAHSFNLFFVVMALNIVPGAIQGVTYQYQLPHLYWTHGYWVRFMFWEYMLMVFLFWWWVGWKIDLKAASLDCSRTWTIVEIILGLALLARDLSTPRWRAAPSLPECWPMAGHHVERDSFELLSSTSVAIVDNAPSADSLIKVSFVRGDLPFSSQRQTEVKNRSMPQLAGNTEAATVGLHDGFADGQPHAGAVDLHALVSSAVELFED